MSVPLLLITLIAVSVPQSCSRSTQFAFVDPHYKLVEWEGWGTELLYSGDILGGFSQPVQDEITRYLFSPNKLNLNIVRYHIGETTPGKQCGTFWPGTVAESFRDAPNAVYNWERDSRARKILLAAKSHGADIFEAFSRSPPGWLTKNGCTNGNPDAATFFENLDPKNTNTFADYLTEVVQYYETHHNVSFSFLAPVNQPARSFAIGAPYGAEGCHMQKSTILEVVKSIQASLQAKNLTACHLVIAGDIAVDETILQNYLHDAGVSDYYSKVNVDIVSAKANAELYSVTKRANHKLWAIFAYTMRTNVTDITQGVNIANLINWNIRNGIPSAIVNSQPLGNTLAESSIGLIEVPFNNATVENIQINSGFYAFMQFSKYIKKGYTIIHTNDWDSLAAHDPKTGTLVVVTINSGENAIIKGFDLSGFFPLGQTTVFRTSLLEPHVPIPSPPIVNQKITFELPARSVTTFRATGAVLRIANNLIGNGNFESGSPSPWRLLFGTRADNGINGNYTFLGSKSGFLDLAESKLSLVQNVTVSKTKAYFLSAWCASTGPTTVFGVLINGLEGPHVTINPSMGYQLYGLTIDAARNDELLIYFQGEQGNYAAQIDEVALH